MDAISRRTVLRGVGAAIALPWLEAMGTAGDLLGKPDSSQQSPPRRAAWMYIPNGVIGDHWFPGEAGTDVELPASLQPLAGSRGEVSVVTGLGRTYLSGEPHSQAGSCWLTSAEPNERLDGVTAIDTTLDQLIARQIGQETPFPSLELSCNSFTDHAEPKIFDAISWYAPGNDAKSINDPRRAFKRLFGKSAGIQSSVLDTVLADAHDLQQRLGMADRRKIDEYLTSVRAIEHRLNRQSLARSGIVSADFEVPENLPNNRRDYIRLMGDLMILAFQTDQTRIATMMVGPERWETPQLYDGVFDKPVNHHVMTHDHRYDEQVAKIDQFHVAQFVYLVNRMQAIQEGESSMLDNTCFVLGSGIGDGASHSYENLPVLVAGRCGGKLVPGGHRKASAGTPLANLWLTIAQAMGASIDRFADSTQPLSFG